jgi:hypothetical protein
MKGKGATEARDSMLQNSKKYGRGLGQVKHYFNQFNLEEAGLPSNVKDILERRNDAVVNSITIGRNPVQSAIQGILKTVSTVPYDNLFHLFLVFNTNKGQVLMEKNARINMSVSSIPKMYESIEISNVPHYTIKEYVAKTRTFMGDKFIPYHPSTNNCQDFILSVLMANGISEGHDFVKQDTTMIFKNKDWLSNFAHSVTNLGGYADVVLQGGLIKQMKAGNLSNELTNTDINSLAKQFKIPKFRGCFIRDEIPKLKVGESCIINLNGQSHWTSLIRLPDGYFYFDSFGVIGPRSLDGLDYVYSEVDLQKMASSACGFYCLAFLISMNRRGDGMRMYEEFIMAFKSPEDNDVTLKKRFKF